MGFEPPFAETTPLIVKYIHKGNIHYLVEKHVKKIAIRRRHISIGGGQRGMVEDYTFTFFWYPSLIETQ